MTSDIAKDGDIVLVVGEDQERLRVYSVVMTIVSQPFRALLGPHYKEGQQSSTPGTQLKEIVLPEDNAVAIDRNDENRPTLTSLLLILYCLYYYY